MPASQAQLDRMFQALSDGARRRMLERLSRGAASGKELADAAGLALPSTIKHLRMLEDGGMVRSSKAGRVRTFRMAPDALRAVSGWVAQREADLTTGFDRLARAMAALPEDEE